MWDWIVEHFYTEPERMIARGQTCINIGGFLLLAGMIGWVAKRITGVVQLHVAKAPAETLVELFGSPLATWWIPEGFGFFIAAALTFIGVLLVTTGRRLRPVFYSL